MRSVRILAHGRLSVINKLPSFRHYLCRGGQCSLAYLQTVAQVWAVRLVVTRSMLSAEPLFVQDLVLPLHRRPRGGQRGVVHDGLVHCRDGKLNALVASERVDGPLGHEVRRRSAVEDLKEDRNSPALT